MSLQWWLQWLSLPTLSCRASQRQLVPTSFPCVPVTILCIFVCLVNFVWKLGSWMMYYCKSGFWSLCLLFHLGSCYYWLFGCCWCCWHCSCFLCAWLSSSVCLTEVAVSFLFQIFYLIFHLKEQSLFRVPLTTFNDSVGMG